MRNFLSKKLFNFFLRSGINSMMINISIEYFRFTVIYFFKKFYVTHARIFNFDGFNFIFFQI